MKYMPVLTVGYWLASYFTVQGSSVYVIKMSQPVTNSLVNRILFKKSGTIEELFGTPFIVLGALSYTRECIIQVVGCSDPG